MRHSSARDKNFNDRSELDSIYRLGFVSFFRALVRKNINPFRFVFHLFEAIDFIMATLTEILSALDVNTRLTAQAADSSAQSLAKVIEGFATLKNQLAQLDITPEQLNDLQNMINSNSDILQAVIETQGKISETAAQTSPSVPSPVDPIPPTEPTLPENPVEVPEDISEDEVDLVESSENIGLPGSVEIDLVDSSESD